MIEKEHIPEFVVLELKNLVNKIYNGNTKLYDIFKDYERPAIEKLGHWGWSINYRLIMDRLDPIAQNREVECFMRVILSVKQETHKILGAHDCAWYLKCVLMDDTKNDVNYINGPSEIETIISREGHDFDQKQIDEILDSTLKIMGYSEEQIDSIRKNGEGV